MPRFFLSSCGVGCIWSVPFMVPVYGSSVLDVIGRDCIVGVFQLNQAPFERDFLFCHWNFLRVKSLPFAKVKTKWTAGYISLNKQSVLTLKCIDVLATVTKVVRHAYLGSNQSESRAYHKKLSSTYQIEVFAISINKMATLIFWPIIQVTRYTRSSEIMRDVT